ncbi:monogalactosyldiacylglycerol synthase, chloroplastic-like isoform X3 [Durio zibethinus]|uniref:Monogalactosyldiacylglycerol synthase, chloroplastic-like isoform X3 n=1 Tax=Durio zibethinus TaxID=66656 RepID=A0A6P5ZUX7_DURZI|nr:monogalactosyldiacylglycerol synthase, chloroplastic-like isoform X3 [Durio zibethinus]
MSDTVGGYRVSAEAIKATFNEEFGDDYQVFVTNLWSDHTPWPFNQLPKSYNFLVKLGSLWKMTYYISAPRVVHQSNFAATSTFIARRTVRTETFEIFLKLKFSDGCSCLSTQIKTPFNFQFNLLLKA